MAGGERRRAGAVPRGGRHPRLQQPDRDGAGLHRLPRRAVHRHVLLHGRRAGSGGRFDDTWSIGQKTAWIKTKGLLGAMIWEMSGDTTGTLMTALNSGL